jgi:hypothetical protein
MVVDDATTRLLSLYVVSVKNVHRPILEDAAALA